jgi:uncharacterized membrane protein
MITGIETPESSGFPAPGVGSSYSHAWNRLWKTFWELLIIAIIGWAFSIPASIPSWFGIDGMTGGWNLFTTAYNILVITPLGYGISYAYLKSARGETPEINHIFEGFRNWGNAILAGILTGLIIFAGFILLVIPGIIFACKLAFVPYLLTERKVDATSAIKESWRMTNGHAGTIFLIGLLGIPIAIAGLICFGIGIIIAVMWITLAGASLYYAVSHGTKVEEPGTIIS